MFNSGNVNLKFSKKRNQWENSTQSCRITVNENEKDFIKGYSYREVIFYYEDSLKAWVFNNYKFSPTTTAHQSELAYRLRINGAEKIIYGNFTSLNDGFKFEKLEVSVENHGLVSEYFPKKLKEFIKLIEEKEKRDKEKKDKNRIKNSLENVKFKTKKGFLKALNKFQENSNNNKVFYRLGVYKAISLTNLGLSLDEIRLTYENTDNIEIDSLLKIENNEILKEIFKESKINLYSNRWSSIDLENLKILDQKNLFQEFLDSNEIDSEILNKDYPLYNSIKEYLSLKNLSDITE